MKKLEDIPKKRAFQAPDGYFDSLPARIRSRIDAGKPEVRPVFFLRYRLQYALPAILLLAVGLLWFAQPPDSVAETLATIETEQLVAYLEDTGISTEELLNHLEFSPGEVEEIETEAYSLDLTEEELNTLLDLDTLRP